MSSQSYLFTSESVSMGHPDKVADQISDAILDHCLSADPTSRVACETLVTTDLAVVAGEITTKADLSRAKVDKIVRDTIRSIGYVDPDIGFAADTCQVQCMIHSQSPDISMGVDVGGAGDQGMMFGIRLQGDGRALHAAADPPGASSRRATMPRLRESKAASSSSAPTPKSQVTVEYNADGTPNHIHTVVLSTAARQDGDGQEGGCSRTDARKAILDRSSSCRR